MSRTTLVLVLLGASIASADITNPNTTINLPPPPPLPYPHNLHSQCHSVAWTLFSECAAIRQQEQTAGDAYAKAYPTDVIDANGQHKTGRRDLANQTSVTGTTSDASFVANAATKRFIPPVMPGASSHPELEDADNPSLDSCTEWVYKRYYGVNRYLDTLGGYLAARRYWDAVNAILAGIPGPIQAPGVHPKACASFENAQLRDFDGNPISPFGLGASRPAFDPIAPKATGYQPKNEFMGLSTLLAPPPAGYIDPNPAHDAAYWADYTAAYNASQVNPTMNDGTRGEFGRAAWGAMNWTITHLSVAEADDIAVRKLAMRRATAAVASKYARCLMQRFRDVTSVANLGPGTWQDLQQYADNRGEGWTDPVDLDEVALEVQLFDSTLASSALSTVLAADTKSLYQSGAWARSKTGSLLRALSKIDATALSTSVGTTAYTIKQLGVPQGCDVGDELDALRDLIVTEWRLPNRGCYSPERCDFNAKVFVGDMVARLQDLTAGEDDAKRICVGATSDDWTNGATTVDTTTRHLDLADFETWLKNKNSQLFAIFLNTPHASSLTGSIGDVKAGGSDWGNGTFGAGYSYSSEWAVNVSSTGTLKNPFGQLVSCSVLGGRVDGQLNAYATAFGYSRSLIDAGLTAQTAQKGQPATLSAHANILGEDLFEPIVDQALPTDYSPADEEDTTSFTLATAYVTVGPFPVKVSVDVGFDWGYHMKFGFTQSGCAQKPTLGVTGELAPFAGTNASVSAGIDLFVVGVGVRFTLTLVSASLPFDASVSVGPNPSDTSQWAVTAKSNLVLDLSELAGKVSLFITTFGVTVMEFELFSWPGLHQHFDLWHEQSVFPFSGFSLLQ